MTFGHHEDFPPARAAGDAREDDEELQGRDHGLSPALRDDTAGNNSGEPPHTRTGRPAARQRRTPSKTLLGDDDEPWLSIPNYFRIRKRYEGRAQTVYSPTPINL